MRGRASRAAWIAAAGLVVLHGVGAWASLGGRADLWGLAPWLGAARGPVLVWLLLPLPIAALEWWRLGRPPRLRVLLLDAVLVVGVAGLWLFRDALSLDGDGRLLLKEASLGVVRSESAPWLNGGLVALAGFAKERGLAIAEVLRAASVIAGAGFVLVARRLWREWEADPGGVGLLLFLAGPFVLLFAGWIELYPFVWLVGLGFLAFAVAATSTARAFPIALAAGALIPLVHPSLALLLPALLVPAWAGPAAGPLRGRLRVVAAVLAIAGALALRKWLIGPWPGSGFLAADPERLPYGLVDPRHFLETAWLLLLLAPAAVVLPFLRGRLDRREACLAAGAAGAVAGAFLVLPALGYARDWDLMALPALPLAILAARRVERAGSRGFAAVVLALVLARTAGWIAVHHDPEASIARARAIAGTSSLNSAFARSYLHDDLSHVLEDLGRPEEAAAEAIHAAELRPASARMHYRVGYLARRYGDPVVAESSLAEAVRIDPGFFDARHELGMMLVARAAWDEAVPHLRAAVDLRPQDIRVRANLAVTLIHAGRGEEAAPEVAWIAASTDPARPRALDNIVRALEDAGATEAAARVRELL